jgi:hypothetical protein
MLSRAVETNLKRVLDTSRLIRRDTRTDVSFSITVKYIRDYT